MGNKPTLQGGGSVSTETSAEAVWQQHLLRDLKYPYALRGGGFTDPLTRLEALTQQLYNNLQPHEKRMFDSQDFTL